MSNQLKKLLNEIEPIENKEYLDSIVKRRDELNKIIITYDIGVLKINQNEANKIKEEYSELNNEILDFVKQATKIYADKCFNVFIQYTNTMK